MKFTSITRQHRDTRTVSPAASAARMESLENRVFLHAGHHEVGTGLLGEYFASADQTNMLIARAEPAVNFKWGKRSPSPELPKDNFSARLSGQYMAVTTERYRFRLQADDGVRVAFNGTTVIDRWVGKGRKGWNVFEVDLVEGTKYDLRIDYADRKGKAGLKLMSRTPTMKKWQVVSAGQLFPPPPAPVDPPPVDPPPVDPPPVDPPPVDPPPVDPPPVDPPPVEPPPTDPGPGAFTQITWSNLAAAPIKRAESLRAVINGKLYVFGGFSDTLGPVTRSDVYDPATNTWTQIADLPTRLTHAGVAADDANDVVYFAGGYLGKPGQTGYSQTFGTTEVWRYDVAANTFTAITPLPAARAGGGLVLIGSNLHYFGGDNLSRNIVTDHYVLNLASASPVNNWTTAAPMPAGRSHMGYVAVHGHILAIGGQTGNDAALTTHASVFHYDPAADEWTTRAPMPKAVSHISSSTFVFGDRVIVAGGETAHNRPVADVFAFDHDTNAWATLTSLPASRFSGVAAAIDDQIFFTGGSSQTTSWLGTPVPVH
jgi:N-acetylneuraminic acid mutarotase